MVGPVQGRDSLRPKLIGWRVWSLAIAAMFVGTACGGGTSPGGSQKVAIPDKNASGTLQIWGFGDDNVTAKSRLDAFKAAYPSVKIELTPGSLDPQKFLSAVAAGAPPDLVNLNRAKLSTYANRNALTPLDDYFSAAKLDTNQFRSAAMKPLQVNGKTYGVPEFNNVIVAYVNNKALKDAGAQLSDVDFSNWQKLSDLNRKLSKMGPDGKPQRVGVDPKLPEFTPLWVYGNNGRIISDDGKKAMLDSKQTVDAVSYAAGLRDAYGGQQAYDGYSQSWDIFGKANPLAADQLGVTLFEQWWLATIGKVSPDADFSIVPFKGRNGKELTYADGNSWAVPRGSKNAGLATAFMKFMTDPDTWVLAAKANVAGLKGGVFTGIYTANTKADKRIFAEVYKASGKASFDDAVKVFQRIQDEAVTLPPSAAGNEVVQDYTDAVRNVLLKRQPADAAMRSGNQKIQAALTNPG